MKPSAIVGALVVGSLSLLSLSVIPILFGGLEEAGRLTKAGIGQAAMLELFGLALGAAVGGYWMGRGAMRLKTAAVAAGLVAVNILTPHAGSMMIVLLERAAAGLLAGFLFGAGNAIIVRAANPDRLMGILVGGSVIPPIILAYLIPVVLTPRFGIEAGFYAVACGMLIALIAAFALVDKVRPLEAPAGPLTSASWPLALFVGALVLQSCGLGAAWTYIERLSSQHGFGPSVIGLAVSGALASQVAAGALSAWAVPKVAKWLALLILVGLQTGFIAVAILAGSPGTFIAAVCLFGGAAAAVQAFQMAEIIALDPTRRTAPLVSPLILVGNGLGPLLASFLTTQADVSGSAWAAVAMSTASLALYLVSAFRWIRLGTAPALESRSA